MRKIRIKLDYEMEIEDNETLDDYGGDVIGEIIGQQSANEIISGLNDLAEVQLIENGRIMKRKEITIF